MNVNNNTTTDGDILFINKIPLSTTIILNIRSTTIEFISNRTTKQIVS